MDREKWLKNVEMRGCDEIPCRVAFAGAVRNQYRERLLEVMKKYPELVGTPSAPEAWNDFGPRHRYRQRWRDRWGCEWDNRYGGIEGQVVEHPLADWSRLATFEPPDPAGGDDMRSIDWKETEENIRRARQKGEFTGGGVSHGFLFQRLYYLRGFNNLMMDIATRDPRLDQLIETIVQFNMELVKRQLQFGVDVMYFGDDLGMQDRLTISPSDWRRYIKPGYATLFAACREAGTHVYLHSDGYFLDIMPDLIEIGVTILNPQDLCNGLENIKRELKGKICIDLDIDRQKIVPWGTPAEIDAHIRKCVQTLSSPQGGLMLVCGIYPGTPLENIEAVLAAMSKYRTWPRQS